MKKLTIIYIIFAFVLTSFTGCTKFRETIDGSHNQFDMNQSDIQQEEKQLNEQQLLNPNASAASSDTSVDSTTSDASASDASTAAQTVKDEENWSEWTSRQWNENSQKWIVGAVVAAVALAAKYYYDESQELNITPPLDWRRHVIPQSAWWSSLEPHQQDSFARYSVEHFYNTAWTEEPRPRWQKPPSRGRTVEMRVDLMRGG